MTGTVVPEPVAATVGPGLAVFVAVTGKENTYAKRPIRAATATHGWVPVSSGLKEGEPVVVRGSFVLKAEMTKGEAQD